MDDQLLSFGAWLRRRRKALDLTQEALAGLVGCSKDLIVKIEGDARRPSREIAALLAVHLQLPPAEHADFIRAARAELSADRLPPPAQSVPRPVLLRAPTSDLPTLRHNLPAHLNTFLGRARETMESTTLLRQPMPRLLTLTGPGGTGKTRLALHTAELLLPEFPDGVWFVDLAPISTPEQVAPAMMQALGLREVPDQTPQERLLHWVRTRRLLLLLDNFEQVLDAAPLVAVLLRGSPELRVLVTSRAPLRLQGEQEYPVGVLEFPPPVSGAPSSIDALTQYDAVRLFIERVRAVRPEFQVTNANAPAVAEICYRLNGLPLAIELAAARIRMFAPEALLSQLPQSLLPLLSGGARDLPARQQTITATIVAQQIDRPILNNSYSIYEDLYAAELDNMWVAFCWLMNQPAHHELMLQMACGLAGVTYPRRQLFEVYTILKNLIYLEAHFPPQLWAQSLHTLGFLAAWRLELGDEPGRAWLEQARVAYRSLNDTSGEIAVLEHLAWLYDDTVEIEQAYDMTLDLSRRGGHQMRIGWGLHNVGSMRYFRGDCADGVAMQQEAYDLFERLNSPVGRSYTACYLGRMAIDRADSTEALHWLSEPGRDYAFALALHGDLSQATSALNRCITEDQAVEDRVGSGMTQQIRCIVSLLDGDPQVAYRYGGDGLIQWRQAKSRWHTIIALSGAGAGALACGDLQVAYEHYRESLYLLSGRDGDARARRVAVAYALEGIASALYLARRIPDRTVISLYRSAAQIAPDELRGWYVTVPFGMPLARGDHRLRDSLLATIRTTLGDAAFEAAWAAGRALTLDEAVAEALALAEAADAGG